MMQCTDRLSGETFEAEDEEDMRGYLAEGLNEGETVAYEVTTDTGEYFAGEVTG